MKKLLIILILSSLFISCQSTKVYNSYEETFYSGKTIVSETKKNIKGKPKKIIYNKYLSINNMERIEEKLTVISKTDFKFISYSFFLKPFVILGASAVSIGKCLALSTGMFVFTVGYNLFDITTPQWFYDCFPSFKDEGRALRLAKIDNAIYYPECYKPFTRNHIIVEKTTFKASAYKTDKEATVVIGHDIQEYDNTIYVQREIKKDYKTTVHYVRYIGTIISIPIYVISALAACLI